MFEVALDANEDFDAALFMAAHGWYRQAMGTLRSAIEALSVAAGFAIRKESAKLRSWRDGLLKPEPKFGNARDFLKGATALDAAKQAVGGAGLFGGPNPAGVLQTIYNTLCPYNHSQADATNGAIWSSNGPVYVYEAFGAFGDTYKDVMAMG